MLRSAIVARRWVPYHKPLPRLFSILLIITVILFRQARGLAR
jgi:hypothetical protein